jgi:methionine sulfoxide reductase catalytic subunit
MDKRFKSIPVKSSEITPKHIYLSRRDFIKATGVVAGSIALAACAPQQTKPPDPVFATQTAESKKTDELGNPVNSFKDITNYNNYYEFTPNKSGVAYVSRNFRTLPWDVEIYGLVNNPQKYGVEDLIKKCQPKERIYRLRCVEGWSMVIPWIGFPLWKLLNAAGPTSDAKFVRFETLLNHAEMPGEGSPYFPFPYQEGLRMDEAMHDLTILATGMYGGELPAQDGGGLRLVVPWKYGFKSIKAIVKIELVDKQPQTFWSTTAPKEYGFYANVNPNVDHPRWSQATERRIGEISRRPTLMFNGYADQVAHFYNGMDLKGFF